MVRVQPSRRGRLPAALSVCDEAPVFVCPAGKSRRLPVFPTPIDHRSKPKINGAAETSLRATGWRLLVLGFALAICGVLYQGTIVDADEWQPISPDELKMTSLPEAPGAPAVILFRQVDRDDNAKTGNEQNYMRIKILTEEGRKYADVEIPYFHDQGNVIAIRARTVRPDGSVAN